VTTAGLATVRVHVERALSLDGEVLGVGDVLDVTEKQARHLERTGACTVLHRRRRNLPPGVERDLREGGVPNAIRAR
jgi:hypothetical protein